MKSFTVLIGEHYFRIRTRSASVYDWFVSTHHVVDHGELTGPNSNANLLVDIVAPYGESHSDDAYTFYESGRKQIFIRTDYALEIDFDRHSAMMHVHDGFSLRHAMMNLYSSYIAQWNWGVLMHSSCLVQNESAYLFSGRSGAGKSTVASLSAPRALLSDEASIVKISEGGVHVFDSPFRSETRPDFRCHSVPLREVNLLVQSSRIKRTRLNKGDALIRLLDKVFFWSHSPRDMQRLLAISTSLVETIPVYELEFQKNDLFWEEIS